MSQIEEKIISMYSKRLSTRQISEQVDDESISVAFPNTEYQRCIVHQVRNTLKHVSDKYRKEFAKDLKLIYHVATEEQGYSIMLEIMEKWQKYYPNAIKSCSINWHCICPNIYNL